MAAVAEYSRSYLLRQAEAHIAAFKQFRPGKRQDIDKSRGVSPERSIKSSSIPMYQEIKNDQNPSWLLWVPIECPEKTDRTLKHLTFNILDLAKGKRRFQLPLWKPKTANTTL